MADARFGRFRQKLAAAAQGILATLTAILFLTMIFLTVLYMIQIYQYSLTDREDIPADVLLQMNNAELPSAGQTDRVGVLPQAIGFRFGEESRGICANYEIIRDYTQTIGEYLQYVFGPSSVGTALDEGTGMAMWQYCLESEQYIYLRYPVCLPVSVLFGGENAANAGTAGGDDAMVRELFLQFTPYGSGSYTLRAVVRDDAGRVTAFALPEDSAEKQQFTVDRVMAYTNHSSFSPFSFAAMTPREGSMALLNDMNLLFSRGISIRRITAAPAEEPLTQSQRIAILRLFSFNPDKITAFDDSGDRIYVEKHGTLRLAADGSLQYTASGPEGGLALSDYLSYDSLDARYNLADYLDGSEALLNALGGISSVLVGGDARLQVSALEMGDDRLIVEYGYFCDNIRLYAADGQPFIACRLIISGGKIMELHHNALNILLMSQRNVTYPISWAMDLSAQREELIPGGLLSLGYLLGEEDTDGLSAEWVYSAVLAENEEESP